MRILLIDDDAVTTKTVVTLLRAEGYVCDSTEHGEDGLEIAKIYEYDLILMDLILPDMDGFDVVRRLRAGKLHTPVLVLSERCGPHDRVKCLDLGADDFLAKPFNNVELLARIQAVVRRSKGFSESIIRTGSIAVNLDAREVRVDNKPLRLTSKEYEILELLSLRKGTTLTKEMFFNHLYHGMDEPELKIIDVFICKLRKKLSVATGGHHCIETVWGSGYALRDPDSSASPGRPDSPKSGVAA